MDSNFPCSLVIEVPFPTHRLASTALQALQVDAELSPLVQRAFSISSADQERSSTGLMSGTDGGDGGVVVVVLRTHYKATTNRMLRVAVNGYMESLGLVLGLMEELDVDVLQVESGREISGC